MRITSLAAGGILAVILMGCTAKTEHDIRTAPVEQGRFDVAAPYLTVFASIQYAADQCYGSGVYGGRSWMKTHLNEPGRSATISVGHQGFANRTILVADIAGTAERTTITYYAGDAGLSLSSARKVLEGWASGGRDCGRLFG